MFGNFLRQKINKVMFTIKAKKLNAMHKFNIGVEIWKMKLLSSSSNEGLVGKLILGDGRWLKISHQVRYLLIGELSIYR